MDRPRGICKHCKEEIFYYGTGLWTPWVHSGGSKYCLQGGYTKTPITEAQPVLETKVL